MSQTDMAGLLAGLILSIIVVGAIILILRFPTDGDVCPGCGKPLIRWAEMAYDQGYRTERLWHGCPVYRELADHEATLGRQAHQFEEMRRHYAVWRKGKTTPIKDQP